MSKKFWSQFPRAQGDHFKLLFFQFKDSWFTVIDENGEKLQILKFKKPEPANVCQFLLSVWLKLSIDKSSGYSFSF